MVGLLVHVAIHPLCYMFVAWPYLGDVWVTHFGFALTGWVCVAILTFFHFLEDWFRVRQIAKGWDDNTLFYLWEQAVHIVVLWFLCPGLIQPLHETWPLMGTLFVLVTHCATVTIWFIEKDIYGRNYPETEEKYISILQRLVVWLTFFLPQPWWIIVLAVVLFTFARHVWTRKLDFSWASIIMGNVIAIGCGLIGRFSLNYHF
jgi:hypothetical protein